jgi:alpha-glucosidase
MPWSSTEPNLGFSVDDPWLPAAESHRALSVDLQDGRDGSLLEFTRECIALRNAHHAIRTGSMEVIEVGEALLIFERAANGQRLRCSFNLSNQAVPFSAAGMELMRSGKVDAGSLGAYAATIEEIA